VTTEEKIERLAGIVESLAGSVVAHDNQIEAHNRQIGAIIDLAATQQRQIAVHDAQIEGLIAAAEQQRDRLGELARAVAATERQWQAYINTLPRL
jgi:chromosome segregation ATPase